MAAENHEGGKDLADSREVADVGHQKSRRVGEDVNEQLLLAVGFLVIMLERKSLQPSAIYLRTEQMRKLLSATFNELPQRRHKVILAEIYISFVIICVEWSLVAFPNLLHPGYDVLLNYQLLRSFFEDYSHTVGTQTAQLAASIFYKPVEQHHQVAPIS